MEAKQIRKGTSMGRHRMCRGRTNSASTTAAERARKQASTGPRASWGMAASGGLFTNAPLVLHNKADVMTISRPRRKDAFSGLELASFIALAGVYRRSRCPNEG